MEKRMTTSILLLGAAGFVSTQITFAAPVSFQEAVAHYSAGKYGQASTELESYKQAYPNNAMVHYYLALCKQAMGQLEGAKTEYLWVAQNGDARLKGMAQSGFDQLSKARSSAGSSSSSVSTASSDPAAAATSRPPVVASAKVKKIIEFYADW